MWGGSWVISSDGEAEGYVGGAPHDYVCDVSGMHLANVHGPRSGSQVPVKDGGACGVRTADTDPCVPSLRWTPPRPRGTLQTGGPCAPLSTGQGPVLSDPFNRGCLVSPFQMQKGGERGEGGLAAWKTGKGST